MATIDNNNNNNNISAMTLQEPNPLEAQPKSYLDLVGECDNFPYYHSNPKTYLEHLDHFYAFKIALYPDVDLGYMLPSVAKTFRGLSDWKLDEADRSLTLVSGDTEPERSQIMALTTEAMRRTHQFKVLSGWRDELYPVYGPNRDLLVSIERAASPLFGVLTYGCHMTGYTKSGEELRIWTPRRAATKQTYGGMLDNTVAGGISTGETPLESMIRESGEEASLPEEYVRKHIRAVGAVTYFHIRDERAGGESGLLQPECQFLYDLELPTDIVPKPSDDEVEGFELMSVEEVKSALRSSRFKPNCALVLLEFFVRHGILTHQDEGYIDIIPRLHRALEFPSM